MYAVTDHLNGETLNNAVRKHYTIIPSITSTLNQWVKTIDTGLLGSNIFETVAAL